MGTAAGALAKLRYLLLHLPITKRSQPGGTQILLDYYFRKLFASAFCTFSLEPMAMVGWGRKCQKGFSTISPDPSSPLALG